MTAYECNDCHHQWTQDDEPEVDLIEAEDWGRIPLAELAAKIRSGEYQPITPSVNTRAVQSDSLPACPCCGSGNTIEKVSV